MSGIILNCTGVIGLILIAMGTTAAFMFIFDIKKVKVGGKNKLQYKVRGKEVHIEVGHVYFTILLGLLMVITPFPISKYFGDVATAIGNENATPTIYKLKEGRYTIREEEIRIDLRKRKEIGWTDYLGSELSETERLIRIELKEVESGTEEVNFRYGTSVHSIAVIEQPVDTKWRKAKEEDQVHNPFINLLEEKGIFEELLARKGRMRTYYMSVPVREGSGQEICYRLKYNNAFQGKDFEWASEIVSADTDAITMHITFPEGKPFKSYEAYKRTADADDMMKIDDPKIDELLDKHVLTWNIRNAKKGEVYYIKWKW